ncbi:LacI family DNA-binding transcriptional regulator [Jeotgalibaca sp. A122]|uniref:LacI family DNA-binding transcriptional regulator n=1 Tax=Jeotgalibaca sp. A122 TaxID=3457322 RepID=UPI003FD2C272
MVTIRQIAKEAGVSKSTVSRYLNDGYVSEDTAEKIKTVIDKYNFVPNKFARTLKSDKSNFIGVIIPRIDSPSAMSMLDGIDRTARANGFQILISNTDLEVGREIESIYSLVQNKVAGIILIATEITPEHLEAQESLSVPILFIGQNHDSVYSVNHDNYLAGKTLAENLLPFGHKDVTYVGVSEHDQSVGVERKKGVVETFKKSGITVTEVESTFRTKDNYYLALDLLKESTSTLYIAATDNMAMGFYRAAHDLGLVVGKDISIAGFGGYAFSEFLTPPLTTMDFHHELVGETAAFNLFERIAGKSIARETTIAVTYLKRKSVI